MRNLRRRNKRRRSKEKKLMLFNIQGRMNREEESGRKKVSATNAEGPPVPIPNTEVKLCSGDNTSREAVREDSSMLTLAEGVMKYSLPKLDKPKCVTPH